MKYTIFIDSQVSGPFDVSQLTELFLNGVITRETQIRLDSDDQTKSWELLGDTFPSISTLPTRSETIQMLIGEIGSTRTPILPQPQRVNVADFDMGFSSMVVFMIKWAIATIPAAIILLALIIVIVTLFGGIIRGLLL